MKRFKANIKLFAVFLLVSLAACIQGCAGTITKDPITGNVTVNVSAGKVEVATHNDLLAAASYADAHGYPERAAFRRAEDTLLTAAESQQSACANAIIAALPKTPASTGSVGPITAAEMGEEAVGNFSGIPANVKILCAPIPLPQLPIMPKP
jgi:hypothetical protein